jgi:hypothetical protein
MQVYHAPELSHHDARLHPYQRGPGGGAGYIDLKAHPDQIPHALEDFVPFAHLEAIQEFFRFLHEINGPGSPLETSDSALRPPRPHRDANSTLALSGFGRIYVLYRDLRLNCIPRQVMWLHGNLGHSLMTLDPSFAAEHGVVGMSCAKILHTTLSNGRWTADGQFESGDNDPGFGQHVILSFWAYGNTEAEVYANLERVFRNIRQACAAISTQINSAMDAMRDA